MRQTDPAERDFESAIVDTARAFGWVAVGHRPMRTKHGWATGWKYDGVGFPDLLLVHTSGHILFAELKVGSNKLSDEQSVWNDVLRTTCAAINTNAQSVTQHVWRPSDMQEIVERLSFGRGSTGQR